ncbi:restriction endonuclease subunit S [Holdemanella biformis]|uniref:restriction endonuclease subunit S n=1 Tax=Holdemanella biformis TaxID=1735 RepID=UPI0024302C16|nr:restriction endonuclease subunit S [Holdemanella biformis]
MTNSMSFGRPYILNVDGCIHDGWLVLSDNFKAFDKDFLYYLLSSKFAYYQFCESVSGAVVKNLNSDKVAISRFAIPPINEQKRIANKIESLVPLIEKYEKFENELYELNSNIKGQLKKSILQYAIEGKLVPQDLNDEPATVLLERMHKEKEKLIADKKIKKDKNESMIYRRDNSYYEKCGSKILCIDEEIPFYIPDNWEWARLGNIGEWKAGATPSKSNMEYYKNGSIPWLLTGDLNDGIIQEIPNKITEKALNETSVKLNPSGSVLIAMYGATIGKLGILSFPATTNQACCACNVFQPFYNLYLFYFLMANKIHFVKQGEGGAQPNISREKIVKTLIPVPPINEQKRIINKIKKLKVLL